MHTKHPLVKRRALAFSFLALLALMLLTLTACQNPSALAPTAPSAAGGTSPANSASTPASAASIQSSPRNAFMYGFSPSGSQGIIVNQDAHSNQQMAITQYVLMNAQYYGVSPDGKNVLFSQVINGQTQYYTEPRSANLANGYFYQLPTSEEAGNALWNSDSRTALVLDKNKGVRVVDTQTGQAHQVLVLPYKAGSASVNRIEKLVFYRDGYIYFIGSGGGACAGVLCRASLADNPQLWQLTDPHHSSSSYVMSSDGQTIYYRNAASTFALGIYAVNADGTHTRVVRASNDGSSFSALPVGFGAHNTLIVVRRSGAQFRVVQLGATPSQDRVLLANAAPGASSLCDSNTFAPGICAQDILLAPSAQAIVVQSTLSNRKNQLWVTDLRTGKQHVLAHPGSTQSDPVQLIGWDVLSTCGSGDNC